MSLLEPRHMQNYSDATALEPHWGYVSRALPCTSDAGSCAYLDVVYHSHDLGMLYIGIIWATIGAILFIWAIATRCVAASKATSPLVATNDEVDESSDEMAARASATSSSSWRFLAAFKSGARRRLLPDVAGRRTFGRTTRLQVLVLAVLAGYLLIWTFVGIVYRTWITPVKKHPGLNNTRTSLGPWSDRVGVLAYGLTPLSILLSNRESLLSILTGVPYHHFNFLHRWLGYIIVAQSLLHTIGWTIIEARLYQPQPTEAQAWITQTYMVWGCVAIILIVLLFVLSLPFVIRRTGYEFFRKAHYVLAIVFIGACWGHWAKLRCFLLPSLLIWFLDRGARLVRSFLLHYNFLSDGTMGFRPAQATATTFGRRKHDSKDDDEDDAEDEDSVVVRLDFEHRQDPWNIGQHFYLCFTDASIWQSHPFTPLSVPTSSHKPGFVRHSYVFRAKGGETKKVADAMIAKSGRATGNDVAIKNPTTGIILTGPYGQSIVDRLDRELKTNVLCIAGGTGITFVLPVLLHLVRNRRAQAMPRLELLWVVRRAKDTAWVQAELEELRAAKDFVTVHICATREGGQAGPQDDLIGEKEGKDCSKACDCIEEGQQLSYGAVKNRHGRPALSTAISSFVTSTSRGPVVVYASGPGEMMTEVRGAVASCNSGSKVWRGDQSHDVELVCDDRLEW
ncbi:hypothetical protein FA10DRAFT_137317 [Acaromyces ingoldii]|uniref:FAD-binding FR-type domain-containing protein n=1 Tax=Acaromyces ingoldii TaxID=215250 RepID=A0A316YM60_9BASI|nr:hypothetical protein FA10DRAFT_137317 [Acaromyces ingoldii]PWN89163.1 hypothetical protein FA10DRAFT_137317 [Acaromyces ingoldii]